MNVVNVFPMLTRARARVRTRQKDRKNIHNIHNIHRTQKNHGFLTVRVLVNVCEDIHRSPTRLSG